MLKGTHSTAEQTVLRLREQPAGLKTGMNKASKYISIILKYPKSVNEWMLYGDGRNFYKGNHHGATTQQPILCKTYTEACLS